MADRTDGGPITQRFAVFRDPENPPDSWRSWSAYTRDFNTAWPSFVGFYEGHGATRRERKADAIKRARIDAMTKAAPPPAPSRVEEARRHASVVKHLFLLRHAHGLLLQHKVPANPDQHAKFLREIDALLDAERDALLAAERAAKGGAS